MDEKADKKAAVEMVRGIALGPVRDGAPHLLIELLFALLLEGIERDARMGAILFSQTAAKKVGAKKSSDFKFKNAKQRVAERLRACRPDDPSLLALIDDCEGVAYRETVIGGVPHLVIIRGPTSEHRRASSPDEYLRLSVEFRPILKHAVDPILGSNPVTPETADFPDFRGYLQRVVTQFEELPDLPGRRRNLSLQNIMPVAVTLPPSSPAPTSDRDKKPRILNLSDAVAAEPCWLLIGEAGEGKTTALHYLAHYFARRAVALPGDAASSDTDIPPIPVYIPLRADGTSLREQLWTALQGPGFTCSTEQLDRWITEKPFLFLVDCLDQVNPHLAILGVQDLMRRAPNSRLVVASRPHKALSNCSWPEARIYPPSDFAMRTFFTHLLGEVAGGDLFEALTRNSLLDPFRRPLFARLLALCSLKLIAQQRFTLAEMFHDVLEEQFLHEWELPADSRVEEVVARDVLACVAHEMICNNTYVLSRPAALRAAIRVAAKHGVAADARTADTLLDQMVKHGLLSESDSGLQFWHPSFRDYFAAVWLTKKRYAATTVYLRSWRSRWSECLVFYFGLLSGRILKERLAHLFIGLRLIISVLSVNPKPTFAARLMLILRCLVQAREHDVWAKRFVGFLPSDGRLLHLSGISPSATYSHIAQDSEDTWRHFYDLLGQLQVPEAFTYLQTVKDQNYAAAGMMHSSDGHIVEQLGRAIARDNPDPLITHYFLTSLQPRCVEFLEKHIRDPEPNVRRQTISAVRFATALYHVRYGADFLSHLESRWVPLLTDYVLHDDDDAVRAAALRFLRNLGFYSDQSIPLYACEAFIHALEDPDTTIRRRAVAAVPFPVFCWHPDIAWRLLNDENRFVVFTALFHFRLCNSRTPKRYARALLKVLRRYAREQPLLRKTAQEALSAIRKYSGGTRGGPLRSFALLVATAYVGPYKELQRNAVHALDMLDSDGRMAPLFEDLLWSDIWEEARSVALWSVVQRVGVEAGPVVLRALEDESAIVRQCAAWICYRDKMGEAFRPTSGPILFRLLTDGQRCFGR